MTSDNKGSTKKMKLSKGPYQTRSRIPVLNSLIVCPKLCASAPKAVSKLGARTQSAGFGAGSTGSGGVSCVAHADGFGS